MLQSPMGSLLLSSGSWCAQNFACALQDWSLCFHQSSGSPIIKSHCSLRPDSLAIPSPFVRSQGWEAWHGLENLHNSARTSLVLFFSSLWVTHLEGMGFDCIVIAPFLPSCCGFVVFGRGVSFIGEFWHPPIDGSSTASCNFGAFAGGDEHASFYATILKWKSGP